MKDDTLMKSTVPAIDGSRFASSPDPLALTVAARASTSRFAVMLPEESLVVDDRSHLTPAQIVEARLINRLKESSLPVSHLQMRGLVRARYEA